MGGGETKTRETPKRLRAPAGGGASGGELDLSTRICEREHSVEVRLVDDSVAEGTQIRVVLGDPLAVIAGQRAIGSLADRRAAATLAGCLSAGYQITGEIVTVDIDAAVATACVVGRRSR